MEESGKKKKGFGKQKMWCHEQVIRGCVNSESGERVGGCMKKKQKWRRHGLSRKVRSWVFRKREVIGRS